VRWGGPAAFVGLDNHKPSLSGGPRAVSACLTTRFSCGCASVTPAAHSATGAAVRWKPALGTDAFELTTDRSR
jgi:hypothetical protein